MVCRGSRDGRNQPVVKTFIKNKTVIYRIMILFFRKRLYFFDKKAEFLGSS